MSDELNADERAYVYDLPMTDEQKVTRYHHHMSECQFGRAFVAVDQDPDGEWVKSSDYDALRRRVEGMEKVIHRYRQTMEECASGFAGGPMKRPFRRRCTDFVLQHFPHVIGATGISLMVYGIAHLILMSCEKAP